MEVPLTQGKVAIIDDEDWPLVAPYKWHVSKQPNDRWYAIANVWNPEKNKQDKLRMHRLLLGVTDSEVKIDHRNLDPLDNRRSNLRTCTNAENIRNRPKDKVPTSSRFKGVSKRGEKWIAQIVYESKHIYLGTYGTEAAAAIAYNNAALRLFGEFARPNPITE